MPSIDALAANRTPVAVVGAGVMGLSLAYGLTARGFRCDVFEASPDIGGVAGTRLLPDGTAVDRFYHTILPTDSRVRRLSAELGVEGRLRFRETRSAFFVDGGLHSMNSLADFLRFTPLDPVQRLRLGLLVARAQLSRDWRRLESVTIREWLRRLGGDRLFERLWAPMLDAKFDGAYADVPATWIWSRLVRMKSTREGANQREHAGYLVGGHVTLLSAMASRIERAGGTIRVGEPVQELVVEKAGVCGLRLRGGFHRCDRAVITTQGPAAARLVPGAPGGFRARLEQVPYLGIVCGLMVLDRPLTGVWTINIADPSIPLTGVIETTAFIDPRDVGGHHLVYLPKYTAPGSAWVSKSDEDVRAEWFQALARMFPAFAPERVKYFLVHRERYVEPLRRVGAEEVPGVRTPVPGLYLATLAQVYPALSNAESVTRHADAAADLIARDAGEGRTASLTDAARGTTP